MVADSALYRDNNLKLLGNLKWLSRTPQPCQGAGS